MNKQTIWIIIIFGGLLAWLTLDYFDHLSTYQQQNIVSAKVTTVSCGGTRGSKITVYSNGEEGTLEVTRQVCITLSDGQLISLLQSKSTGKFYWNSQPLKRIFWLYPVVFLMVAYMLFKGRRAKKKSP